MSNRTKPNGSDVFRLVRKDGSEAEEFRFICDASGKVTFRSLEQPDSMESSLADAKKQ